MNWKLLFSDIVSENGKKHRHAIVVVVLVLDIVLNMIIGLTPFIDNYNRKWIVLFTEQKFVSSASLNSLMSTQISEEWYMASFAG